MAVTDETIQVASGAPVCSSVVLRCGCVEILVDRTESIFCEKSSGCAGAGIQVSNRTWHVWTTGWFRFSLCFIYFSGREAK